MSEPLTQRQWDESLVALAKGCSDLVSTFASAAHAMHEGFIRSETGWAMYRWHAGLRCRQRQYVKAGANARDRMLRRAARKRGRRRS